MLDAVDIAILKAMQADAKTTTSDLARLLSMSETPCWRRLKRLEENGFISRYEAVLNKEALGYGIKAFVQLSVDAHTVEATRELEEKIKSHSGVFSFHNVTGDCDFIIQLICKNIDDYSFFIDKTLRDIPSIRKIKTFISLREITQNNHLNI